MTVMIWRGEARELFSIGGDINGYFENQAFSTFGFACILGQVDVVRDKLKQVKRTSSYGQPWSMNQDMKKLLETRETSVRLSPLQLIVSAGKNVMQVPTQHQIEIASLLLQNGASPYAKDVFGKTVVHYGAGGMATDMTMQVVNMCIHAAKTHHLFGKEVQLHSLKSEQMNGLRGIVGGFHFKKTEPGRRAVYLIDAKKEIWVKPENISLSMEDNEIKVASLTMLADVQDRLGSVSLHEVIMNQRLDVAKFLLTNHKTSVYTKDLDGISPVIMASTLGAASTPMGEFIKSIVLKEGSEKRKNKKNCCNNCNTDLGKKGGLKCSACSTVVYCGKECQKEHWKNGHRKECKVLKELNVGVKVLEAPPNASTTRSYERYSNLISNTSGQLSEDSYCKPRGVNVDEKFVVKIQVITEQHDIMVYDKTRTCQFAISPQQECFKPIFTETRKEQAWNGRKTFMKASFDNDGICTIYPKTAGVKAKYTW